MAITVVINIFALLAMVAGVLLHSGKGGGLSDMFGGGFTSGVGSSGVAERNLNRITVVSALLWGVVIVLLNLIQKFES
jgi:preprotein translocase subunit SecG